MVVKLASKQIPSGFQPSQFRYAGRPAMEQGDFGPEVGSANLTPSKPQGVRVARLFHVGVVEARGQWFVYIERGELGTGRSWDADEPAAGLDFMFVRCRDEADARRFFRNQCLSMTMARLAKTTLHGRVEDAWVIDGSLNHECGLAQFGMVEGLAECEPANVVRIETRQPHSSARVDAQVGLLVRGMVHDARVAANAMGMVPTLEMLEQIADELRPQVMQRIAELSRTSRPRATRLSTAS